MTALIVVFVIILIFAFFLNMKVKAEISYLGGNFNFKVKYLCFTVFPLKEKKKKVKKEKNKAKKNKSFKTNQTDEEVGTDIQEEPEQLDEENTVNSENTEEVTSSDEKKKKSKEPLSDKIDKIFDIIEKVKIIWSVSKKWLMHIFKHIYIEELMVDFLIADEDAYKTAMNYGKINAAVYNFINFIRTFFTVTIKTVDILCDFDRREPQYDFSVKITVRPATILSAVFGILFGLLINIRKLIGKNKKQQSAEGAVSM